jgi:uncharacterized protein YecT (DUF1311 family)
MLPKIISLVLFLSICGSQAALADEWKQIPPPFEGEWVVSSVRINDLETRRLNYGPDAPALQYRLLNITGNSLTGNLPEIYSECKPLKAEKTTMVASALMKDDFLENAHFKDYNIPIQDDKSIYVYRFKCGESLLGAEANSSAKVGGVWVVELQKSRIAMRWHDNTILVLDRVETPIPPSFNCKARLNDTEKTICGSNELSGYDKSVSSAYKNGLTQYADYDETERLQHLKNFRSAQNKWITERNKCGKDEQCIKTSMVKRIDDIVASASAPD